MLLARFSNVLRRAAILEGHRQKQAGLGRWHTPDPEELALLLSGIRKRASRAMPAEVLAARRQAQQEARHEARLEAEREARIRAELEGPSNRAAARRSDSTSPNRPGRRA